jgi:hypothetical protein
LSEGVDASSALINPGGACLRPGWQPVYRRHDLWTGFGMERGNLDQVMGWARVCMLGTGAERSAVAMKHL